MLYISAHIFSNMVPRQVAEHKGIGYLLILRLCHNTTSTDKLLKFSKVGAYWRLDKDMRGVFKRLTAE